MLFIDGTKKGGPIGTTSTRYYYYSSQRFWVQKTFLTLPIIWRLIGSLWTSHPAPCKLIRDTAATVLEMYHRIQPLVESASNVKFRTDMKLGHEQWRNWATSYRVPGGRAISCSRTQKQEEDLFCGVCPRRRHKTHTTKHKWLVSTESKKDSFYVKKQYSSRELQILPSCQTLVRSRARTASKGSTISPPARTLRPRSSWSFPSL